MKSSIPVGARLTSRVLSEGTNDEPTTDRAGFSDDRKWPPDDGLLVVGSTEEAIVTAVNRGGDADTIGAIAGAVAGARFGASTLPDRWFAAVDEMGELEGLPTHLAQVW